MTLLVTWLWQGLAIAAVTTVVVSALPRVGATTRHLTWWAALATVLALPLLLASAAATGALITQSAATDVAVVPAVVLPAVPGWAALVVGALWGLAALVRLAWVLLGWRAVARMRRASSAFDPARAARLPLWSARPVVGARRAELRVSDAIAGACALGYRRPAIVVGGQLARRLDDQALDQVLLHEQAHLDRYDDWTQLLQAFVKAVAGLHPAVWWLSRNIDFDREAACDALVVARTGAARRYATALLQAATMTDGARGVPAIVPGAIARASALRRRVARLLDPRLAVDEPFAVTTRAVTALPAVTLLACLPLAPLVATADGVRQDVPMPVAGAVVAPAPAQRPTVPAGAVFPRAGTLTRAPTTLRVAAQPVPSGQATVPAASPLPISAPAPLESRALSVVADAPSAIPGIPRASGVQTQLTATAGGRWQALAAPPANAATDVARSIASGAGRSGVSLGRAFTRAARTIAGSF